MIAIYQSKLSVLLMMHLTLAKVAMTVSAHGSFEPIDGT